MAEFHLPGHNFTGPGTRLQERLEGGGPDSRPVNAVDAMSLDHDIAYHFAENDADILRADLRYITGAIRIALGPGSTVRERGEAVVVGTAIGAKVLLTGATGVGKPALRAYRAFRKVKLLD